MVPQTPFCIGFHSCEVGCVLCISTVAATCLFVLSPCMVRGRATRKQRDLSIHYLSIDFSGKKRHGRKMLKLPSFNALLNTILNKLICFCLVNTISCLIPWCPDHLRCIGHPIRELRVRSDGWRWERTKTCVGSHLEHEGPTSNKSSYSFE